MADREDLLKIFKDLQNDPIVQQVTAQFGKLPIWGKSLDLRPSFLR